MTLWKKAFPSPAIFALIFIGFIDLLVTAVLHQRGLIVELNPLMKPIIERSELLFVVVKGMTLLLAWAVMVRFYETHQNFVRKVSFAGALAYCGIWLVWFIAGSITIH
ncbi:MAG: DUF5658 family protein [Fimbriimonadaceae bacterium]